MTKKIIAVSLVILMIATCFVACGKDKGYKVLKDEKGIEHAYVTDAEGNTVLDKDGNARVYETNKNGEIVTDANGNKRENSVEMPDKYVKEDGSLKTSIFEVPPIEGWEATDGGKLIKKDTDAKCFITADYAANETNELPFELMVNKVLVDNQGIVDDINSGKYKDNGVVKAESESKMINYQEHKAIYMSYTFYNAKDEVVHHAEAIYFVKTGGSIYVVNYGNLDGVGYDKTFDFLTYANTITIN